MAVAVADLVDNYFVEPRVALANGDREMISMLKMVHRKNLLQPIQKLKEAVQLSKVYIHIRIYMYLQQPNICHRIGIVSLEKLCSIFFDYLYFIPSCAFVNTYLIYMCVCVCVCV